MLVGHFGDSADSAGDAAQTQSPEGGDGDGNEQRAEGQQNGRYGVAHRDLGKQLYRLFDVPDWIDGHGRGWTGGHLFLPARPAAYKPLATEPPDVPRDTSLDEFGTDDADAGSDPEGSPAERSAPSEAGSADGETQADDTHSDGATAEADGPDGGVERAAPTHGWTPGGAACAGCGDTVERRWRADDGEMVCDDCKEW